MRRILSRPKPQSPPRYCIVMSAVDIHVTVGSAVERVSLDGLEERFQELAREMRMRRGRLLLRIDRGGAIVRSLGKLALPASQHRAAALLDLEMATPFRNGSAHALTLRAAQVTGGTSCDYAIVKRGALDRITGALKDAGVNIAAVELDDGALFREVHPVSRKTLTGQGKANRSFRALLTSMILAGALGTYLHACLRQQSAIEALEAASVPLAAEAKTVRLALDERAAQLAEVAALRKSVSERVLASAVWEELSRVLPDSTYITDMTVKTDGVSITGFSASASSIVVTLEGSPLFDQAAFAGPVVKVPGFDGDRFSIDLKLGGKV